MKITDLKEGMHVYSPTKGTGIILKIEKITITTKFRNSTSTITLRSADALISYDDL
jgi:hypothetical protein